MDIGKQMALIAMEAAKVFIEKSKFDKDQIDYQRLTEIMKRNTLAALDEVLKDGRVLIESGNTGWGAMLVKTTFAKAGIDSVKEYYATEKVTV